MQVKVGATVLVVLVTLGACAGDRDGQAAERPAKPRVGEQGSATLHGAVMRDGRPLPGARLVLTADGGGEREATTGPDGEYRFAGVAPGRYQLHASSDSGVTCEGGACISARWEERNVVTLSAGETLRQDMYAE